MLATSETLTNLAFVHEDDLALNISRTEPAVGAPPDPLEADKQPNHSGSSVQIDWHQLVKRIHQGEESGMAELYGLFARGIRYYLGRQLGSQEIDDKVHDTFLIVVQAIRQNKLREPDRLMGFVRTVVRCQVAAHIDHIVHRRREELNLDVGVRVADRRRNPEQTAAFRQRVEFMRDILAKLSERDRELLTRFYLHEESQEQICEEMNLTETQFRLFKSRAKARFGDIGKRKLQQKPLVPLSLRTSGGDAPSLAMNRSWPVGGPSMKVV
jgi:RNA polymerase sigma factor (sigma-70 family)